MDASQGILLALICYLTSYVEGKDLEIVPLSVSKCSQVNRDLPIRFKDYNTTRDPETGMLYFEPTELIFTGYNITERSTGLYQAFKCLARDFCCPNAEERKSLFDVCDVFEDEDEDEPFSAYFQNLKNFNTTCPILPPPTGSYHVPRFPVKNFNTFISDGLVKKTAGFWKLQIIIMQYPYKEFYFCTETMVYARTVRDDYTVPGPYLEPDPDDNQHRSPGACFNFSY